MSDLRGQVVSDQGLVHQVRSIEKDHSAIRRAFGSVPSGVSVLATNLQGHMHAMVASSFMVGVSLDPCLMAIAIQKTSESWPHVRQAGILGMSVFGEGQGSLVHQLSSKDRARRFDGIAVETDELGAVYVEGAAMWFQTRIHDEAEAGDHWMVLLEVLRSGTADATEPLLWHKSKIRRIVD